MPLHLPVLADQQLVLQDQFKELGMGQPVTGRLLKPHVQGLQHAREAQLS